MAHEWRCDTCRKFIHAGATRCWICEADIAHAGRARDELLRRVDAYLAQPCDDDCTLTRGHFGPHQTAKE